jgi:hypothetical protein
VTRILFVPLGRLKDALPRALPPNPSQRCNFGAVVEVTLRSGRTVVYGPCTRPAA